MREVELAKYGTKEEWLTKFECPENILCKHYLKEKGWHLANTLSDSYTAINKFFWVVNSWNIDYRWNKKRNPVLNAGTIILPCIYDMSPFLGAPVEHARCYMAEDFDGYRRTVKDKWFETLSKVLWKFKLDTGILGNVIAEFVCRLFRIEEPIAKGLALGTASHAIGTAKAMELGEVEGAMSSLAIAVAGLMTAVGASLFANLM